VKRIYRAELLADVVHWKNVLEHRGIDCELRRATLGSALGEVPWLETLPELWVVDERDAQIAERIIRTGRDHGVVGEPWRCGECGEQLEGQFTACWNCGAERPVTA
jgi:hypothetical protein